MRKIKKYFIIILLSIFTLTTVETSSLNFSAYIVQAKASSSTKRKAQEAYRKFLTQRRYRYFTLWDIDKDGLKELLVTDGRKPKDALRCEEMRGYLGIILVSTLLITWNIRGMFPDILTALKHAAFQVGSIITTTGYSTTDFDLWPGFSRTILVCLMFIGACAGSTGGGIKVSRIAIAVKTVNKELSSLIHPRNVKVLKYEGKAIEHNVLRSINTYLVAYILIFSVSLLLISLDNFDLTTNFTAIAATLNNIGPGLSKVGPTCNFGIFSPVSKYILMFDMLAGRLELFPMLLLFAPRTWMRE